MNLTEALARALIRWTGYHDDEIADTTLEADHEWWCPPRLMAEQVLADPAFRAALTKALTAALVEVEEDKIGAHPECLDDSCEHTDGCPDWSALGCGDAVAIVAHLLPPAQDSEP